MYKAGTQLIERNKTSTQSGLDWEEVYHRRLRPPFVPKVSSAGDTSNFQEYSDEELEIDPVTEREAKVFEDF